MLELPADRPRPAKQSHRGAQLSRQFPESLSIALVKLSRQEDVTMFMTLLAAFQTLLHRYTGRDESPAPSHAGDETSSPYADTPQSGPRLGAVESDDPYAGADDTFDPYERFREDRDRHRPNDA